MSSVATDRMFENRYELFFEKKIAIPAALVTAFADNSPRFLETEQKLFLEKLEFGGLSEVDTVFTPDTRTVDNLRRILTSITVIFENYQKALAINVQKVKSLFEYFDHIRFITQSFGSAYLHVLDGLDYVNAFKAELLKSLRVTKNVFDYLGNRNASIAVESLDPSPTDHDFNQVRGTPLFDLTLAKGGLTRQGNPGHGRVVVQDHC